MLTTQFSELAEAAIETYRRAVCDAAAGTEIDPQTVLSLALAAGRSAPQLAADVETASERYELSQSLGARDFPTELEAAKAERTAANTALAAAQAKLDAISAEVRQAHERVRAAIAEVSSIGADRDELTRSVGDALAATGDRHEWREFHLGV